MRSPVRKECTPEGSSGLDAPDALEELPTLPITPTLAAWPMLRTGSELGWFSMFTAAASTRIAIL